MVGVCLVSLSPAKRATGDVDEPGTLQEDLLTLLKVRSDALVSKDAAEPDTLEHCSVFDGRRLNRRSQGI